MARLFRCLLLMLLHLAWTSLGSPSEQEGQIREYFIAAQVADWSYISESEDPSRLRQPSQLFKKIIYTEYEADFKKEKPRNDLSGLLGPTLRCEVGDTLIINFINLANKSLSIHPQGITYGKQSEGSSYADKTSPVEKQDDSVLPGQSYKYIWKITTETGPRESDASCLTYAYYSHENMEQDFNSGLIGALLICKKGSLNEDGTQKLFEKEYVLMFGVLDESKSYHKATSLMYTINGYINGTLPAVQACAYDRISWHLIGMSSTPEIFSVHFNGQTLEQNHHKVSTVNLVAGASVTANMSVSKTGKWLISSLVEKHMQAGMHGYLSIEDCGKPDTLTKKLSFKQLRMVKNWDYYIAAEEITWDYAQDIPDNIDRRYRAQYLDNFSNLIGKKYKKAVFRHYKDDSFTRPIETAWSRDRGILGPVIRATVRDTIKIVFKNKASRPYSIYVHGVTLSKEAEGAVYPSESKENSTQGKAVQPGETYTYKWTVLDTDEPTTEDSQCITRLYHSAVDVSRDIASGLIGPLLICKRQALSMKGIQEKADVEQHAVFAVFDENKSWYLEENIKEYCSNPSAVNRDDPKFYRSNVMHTLNGYAADRTDVLGFCQSDIVEWHLTSIGTQDGIIPVHLSGHTFLNKGKHQDILHLFPMSGESATVTMDNIGTWLLSTWGSREMTHGMRLRFRDAKCHEDTEEEEDGYHLVIMPETTKKAQQNKINKSGIDGNSVIDYDEDSYVDNGDAEEQDKLAALLGLRTLNGSGNSEEELNLTAIALEEGANSLHNESEDAVAVNAQLIFVNESDSLHHETVRAPEISDTNNQTFKADSLGTSRSIPRKDWVHRVNTSSEEDTLIVSFSEKEEEKNAGGEDSWSKKGKRRVLTEATLHALKEMCALLLHVQQKRNLSGFDNATFDNFTAFLATPKAEDASNLDSLRNGYLSDYDNENEDEETSNDFFMLSTTSNITWDVELSVEQNISMPDLELAKIQQNDNLTEDGVLHGIVSTVITKTEGSLKGAPRKKLKCQTKKTDDKWNFASEKKNYPTGGDHNEKKLQNSTRNDTMSSENAILPIKIEQGAYKDNTQLEMNDEQNFQNVNCTARIPGTLLKARRKKKRQNVLTPRTSKPLMTPRGFHPVRTSDKAKSTLQNETVPAVIKNQDKPVVTLGVPRGNGDYQEYDIGNIDSEDSSSGSFEYDLVHYDDPYTTDSRLDISTVRNPEDIAGRYLRTFSNGNIRRYYIAAEEVFWDYAAPNKGTGKSRSVYKKVVFRSYQDDTFRIPEARGEYERHLGILGPVIRAEVDDVIQVQFKNLASRPYSLHAHGLYYEKSSEGRSYDDQTPEWFREDDAIMPNETYTYVWHAIQRSGPTGNRKACKSWAYYSAVNPAKDIHSGLIGPILICQKGMLDQYSNPIDMREFVLLFMVFDEEKSWYFNKYDKKTHAERKTHTFPAINGIPYNLPGIKMYTDEEVHWHLINMGGPKDIHVIHFHGQTFVEQGMEDYQLGIYPLLPGTFSTVEMKPSKAGVWLLETEVSEFQKAGMQTTFTVIDKACRLPLGLESGIIKDSQISASGNTGYWEPKLARLNNGGKYNAWSTDKKHNEYPWIQVDLESQVLITGIQTQGAKQLLHSLFTTEYFITYSKDRRKWITFKGNHTGKHKIFKGNSDASGIKENKIDPPIIARYIRVYPNKFYNRPTLRLELLGCATEGCFMPLGMESGAIRDAQITASSYRKTWWSSWEPSLARLNLKGRTNAWQAKSNNNHQWLQIDLLQSKKITGIITQGARSMSSEMFVETFSIRYGDDGLSWKSYLDASNSMEKIFSGNINSGQQAKNFFNPPIFSRFLRIIPKTWNNSIALRIELFGCDAF